MAMTRSKSRHSQQVVHKIPLSSCKSATLALLDWKGYLLLFSHLSLQFPFPFPSQQKNITLSAGTSHLTALFLFFLSQYFPQTLDKTIEKHRKRQMLLSHLQSSHPWILPSRIPRLNQTPSSPKRSLLLHLHYLYAHVLLS
jgi:hypothetical protein